MQLAIPTTDFPVARVIVVVLDGLRADAIPLFQLRQLERLAREGRATFHATTVTPSVTAAAMASLFTGADPAHHGLCSDRFHIPRGIASIDPLPRLLQRAALPTFTFMARLPFGYGRLANRMAQTVGVTRASFDGDGALAILTSARDTLARERRGLFVFHWPDADRAGHASGWTSPAYRTAARCLDETLGALDAFTGASSDPETLLIALADHGGGGHLEKNHESAHPQDRRIPLLLAGGRVIPGDLGAGCSLLDVPATVCWALGVPVPPSFAGRPFNDALSGTGEPGRRYAPVADPCSPHHPEVALCT